MFIYNTIININPVLLWASFITHLRIDDITNDPYLKPSLAILPPSSYIRGKWPGTSDGGTDTAE